MANLTAELERKDERSTARQSFWFSFWVFQTSDRK